MLCIGLLKGQGQGKWKMQLIFLRKLKVAARQRADGRFQKGGGGNHCPVYIVAQHSQEENNERK
jgi:hypothetical protein